MATDTKQRAVASGEGWPPDSPLAARSMCEAFQRTASTRSAEVALRTIGDGVSITFGEYAARVRALAGALHALGVRRGDTVGLMLTNRPEFHLIDSAAMHLGATPFSLYSTSSPEQIAYLLSDAAPRAFVVEAGFLHRAAPGIAAAEAGVGTVVVLDGLGSEAPEAAIAFEDLETSAGEPDGFDFDAAWQAVGPEDVLTLIYTSGTTGPPKGVQLTHGNQLAESRGLTLASPELSRGGGSTVSYLPTAHIADRGLSHYAQMVWGDTLTCCPDPTQVFAHVAECRPTRFGGVPRIWEKLRAALQAGFASDPDPRRRAAVEAALEGARLVARSRRTGEAVPDEVALAHGHAEETIFGPLRARLGFDRCEHFMIGAAPAPVELFEFFAALGISICEVWGMSELTSVATLVPVEDTRYGTAGRALPGVELRIAADGELLVRGPIVMAGYRNQPQKTSETIDRDGWLCTGDIARIDEDGFVSIVDRKKELIINAAGKNMSPANIEGQLKSASPLIGQAMAIGDRRPYNVALIVLDPDAARSFAAERRLADPSLAAMAAEPVVHAEVAAGVARANEHLSRVEQIKRFRILGADWPPAGDELTPTMKLRRKSIAEKYAAEIVALYAGS